MAEMSFIGFAICLSLAIALGCDATCSPTCKASQTCKWTCASATNRTVAVPGADVSACSSNSDDCGTGTTGKCNATCVAPTGKNGSIKYGLSPLILIFGVLGNVLLRP
ncbi:uncharacterized protein [Argopecten irradians]|uniref:uncharacterized protein isoform X2 n=1 Tax=Argopecten irradians TaxID=31199 RepID=UPI003711001A